MATFRKVSPASSSLIVETFPEYEQARARSDSLGIAVRPVRRYTAEGVRWAVVRPGQVSRPLFLRVPSPPAPSREVQEWARALSSVIRPILEEQEAPAMPGQDARPVILAHRADKPREGFKPAPGHVERIGRTSRHPAMLARERRERSHA